LNDSEEVVIVEVMELSLINDSLSNMDSISGSETIRRHYQSLIRKYETLKEEYESLRKRYTDLVGFHGDYVSKIELAQEENFRHRKSIEDCVQERNVAIRERNGLQQQCTAAIRQWDKALRENNELKEQLSKVQQQRDEAMKEINQAMAVRIKATKDMARLTEERNAAVQEYSLIMSERDSVHKEIEKLQEEHSEMLKRSKSLENDKKVMLEEIESLKREIASALFDRDRVLKACNDLREKYGDYVTGINDEVTSPTSPSRSAHNFWGSSSSGVSSSWAQVMSKSTNSDLIKSNHMSAASSNSSVSTFSHQQNKLCSNTRLDNIDQANTEIESLRKQVERLQTDLVEAQQ
jgi:regulator of replication initiation timing